MSDLGTIFERKKKLEKKKMKKLIQVVVPESRIDAIHQSLNPEPLVVVNCSVDSRKLLFDEAVGYLTR